MQKFSGSCSAEQLHTLQKVFDLIWIELRATSANTFTGPLEPEPLREEVARRVLKAYAEDGLDEDKPDEEEITRRVLRSFGIPTDALNLLKTHSGAET